MQQGPSFLLTSSLSPHYSSCTTPLFSVKLRQELAVNADTVGDWLVIDSSQSLPSISHIHHINTSRGGVH